MEDAWYQYSAFCLAKVRWKKPSTSTYLIYKHTISDLIQCHGSLFYSTLIPLPYQHSLDTDKSCTDCVSQTNLKVWDAGQVAEGEWKELKGNKESWIESGWLGLWVSGFLGFWVSGFLDLF
ncbi:hypothetical protein I306_02036 [Cryptococcus gattii EJB2]|uniref:Uncharacterized protein n=1 Tax=Cryptococcus gattii EJB2 TaxID=1296103 RepID=A0ABR5BZ34_9TREE|nr:hypothetical protein I306_02036 [Cryptococcus gattii EJB2]